MGGLASICAVCLADRNSNWSAAIGLPGLDTISLSGENWREDRELLLECPKNSPSKINK